jgi:hypothetical protein
MINLDTMKAYIDTTKTYIQLSSGGLVLPLAIKTQVLNLFRSGGSYSGVVLGLIIVSWVCFLVAIAAAALYQYAAVKFVEYHQNRQATYVSGPLKRLIHSKNGPGVAYGVMFAAFYSGAILVVLYSLAAFCGL